MSLAENIKNGEKFNLVVGDYLIRKFGLPSRSNLAKFFSIKFNDELKRKITDFKSFSKISQTYLDAAVGNRESLVNKIEELYKYNGNGKINKEYLIDFKSIETIISFDYDFNFEKNFSEELVKLSFYTEKSLTEKNENKIKLYKVFGDLSSIDKMMITFQDLRKFKILPMYNQYLNLLTSEFSKRETLILGDEFEDSDFIEFFQYLLERKRDLPLKPIYFLTSKDKLEEKIESFILENNIEVVRDKNPEEFLKFSLESDFKIEIEKKELEELEKKGLKEEENKEVKENEKEKVLEKKEILTLIESDGIFFETAAEIRFRSMKLEENPIYYSNIDITEEGMKSMKLNANSVKIGDLPVLGTKIRLLGNDNLKFIEVKTREFRIKTSVRVARNGEVFKDENYLEYEIYNVNNVRLKQILELFIDLFTGKKLTFKSDNLDVSLNLSHNLHQLKFQIVKEAEKSYEDFFKGSGEEKKFYSTVLSYYQIFLLNSYVRKNNYESWANFTLDEKISLSEKSEIVAVRDHNIKFPNGVGVLREKIQLLEPVEIDRVLVEDGKAKLKHAKIKITLERIS